MRSNDDLYHDRIDQAHSLLTHYELGASRRLQAKLRETIYLLDAREAGQDITLAKLAYDPIEHRCDQPTARLRHHIGNSFPGTITTAMDLGGGFYLCGSQVVRR